MPRTLPKKKHDNERDRTGVWLVGMVGQGGSGWMALHKLWLAKEPEIGPAKKPKDQRQGEVLLDATRFFLSDSHPLNIDFVLSLPEELQPHFNAWCESRHFVPQDELGLLAS